MCSFSCAVRDYFKIWHLKVFEEKEKLWYSWVKSLEKNRKILQGIFNCLIWGAWCQNYVLKEEVLRFFMSSWLFLEQNNVLDCPRTVPMFTKRFSKKMRKVYLLLWDLYSTFSNMLCLLTRPTYAPSLVTIS